MSDLRPISTEGFTPLDAQPAAGPAPMLQWLKIAELRIDSRYQRPVNASGRRTIGRIVAAFDWSKFATVVAAPVEGGLYAIIDGQHRTTAAAICGFESVPCHVVQADRPAQAAAFAAINGNVTKITALQVHAARMAAGDEDALTLAAICEAAGVTIMRYPVASGRLKPGQTLSAGYLTSAAKKVERDVLIRALQCVTQNAHDYVGLLRPVVIGALVDVLQRHPAWLADASRLFDALDDFDLADAAETQKASALWIAIEEHLDARMPRVKMAAAPAIEARPR